MGGDGLMDGKRWVERSNTLHTVNFLIKPRVVGKVALYTSFSRAFPFRPGKAPGEAPGNPLVSYKCWLYVD